MTIRTQESIAIDEYIRLNYLLATDFEIGVKIGLTSSAINGRRRKLGLVRPQKIYHQKERIAMIIEMFVNGATIASISRKTMSHSNVIGAILKKNFFYTKRSYDTITLVIESKINYNEPTGNEQIKG